MGEAMAMNCNPRGRNVDYLPPKKSTRGRTSHDFNL